ncbi:hypothetical protein [Cysteiniphilum marinum]|uniref:hypothetical protein n=1 Tax=Cysteiniphilum marinum TaxID=2774191 RepID=UPI00193A5117|nr:hypothetical protein [Cysteiniphilum marinum]
MINYSLLMCWFKSLFDVGSKGYLLTSKYFSISFISLVAFNQVNGSTKGVKSDTCVPGRGDQKTTLFDVKSSEFQTNIYVKDLKVLVDGGEDPKLGTDTKVYANYIYCDNNVGEEGLSVYEWYFNGNKIDSVNTAYIRLNHEDMISSGRPGILTFIVTPIQANPSGDVAGVPSKTSIYIDNYRDGIPESVFAKSWLNQGANHGFNSMYKFESEFFASTGNDAYAIFDNSTYELTQGGNDEVTDKLGSYKDDIESNGIKSLYSNKSSLAALLNDGNGTLIIWGAKFDPSNNTGVFNNIARVYPGIDEYVVINSSGELKLISSSNVNTLQDPPLDQEILLELKNNVRAVYRSGSDEDEAPFAYAVLTKDYNVYSWGDIEAGGEITLNNQAAIDNHNAIAVYSTRSAFAVLLGNLTVVSWGNADEGGTITSGASSIKNIAATQTSFSGLKIVKNGVDISKSAVTWGELRTTEPPVLDGMIDPEFFSNRNAFLAVDMDESKQNYIAKAWGNIDKTAEVDTREEIIDSEQHKGLTIGTTMNSFILLTPNNTLGEYDLRIWGNEGFLPQDIDKYVKTNSLLDAKGSKDAFAASFVNMPKSVVSWSEDKRYDTSLIKSDIINIFTSNSDNIRIGYGCLHIVQTESLVSDWQACAGQAPIIVSESPKTVLEDTTSRFDKTSIIVTDADRDLEAIEISVDKGIERQLSLPVGDIYLCRF